MKPETTLQEIFNPDRKNFFLLAGPCVVEGEELVMRVAGEVQKMTEREGIPFVFKSSYKKANRSKSDSFTGIGDEEALEILARVRERFGVPVVTDVHSPAEAVRAADYVDILQIPAFLCRQTELLQAAASTGKIVNIKKGQFLSPEAMKYVAEKVSREGNNRILLTERGVTFGYGDLLVDMRSLPVMKKIGFPAVLDCTHSNQQPNRSEGGTGGRPEFIEVLARAGIAAGADGLFIETHPNPPEALSDAANMLPLSLLPGLLRRCAGIYTLLKEA